MEHCSSISRAVLLILFVFLFVIPPLAGTADEGEEKKENTYFLLPPEIINSYLPCSEYYLIPDEPRVTSVVARAQKYERAHNYPQAAKYYAIAFRRAQETPAAPYIHFKQCCFADTAEGSIKCLAEIIDSYPEFPLLNGVRFEIARRNFFIKKYQPAFHFLQEIEEDEKANNLIFTPYVYTFMGIIQNAQGNFEESLLYYRKALLLLSTAGDESLSREITGIYLESAKSLTAVKKYNESQLVLRKIIGTSPCPFVQASALSLLAHTYGLSGAHGHAWAAYQQLSEEHPSSPCALHAVKQIEDMKKSKIDHKPVMLTFLYDRDILTGRYDFDNPVQGPASGASLQSGIAIQLGSFTVEKNAQGFAHELKAKGYQVLVSCATVENKKVFRVRVGFFRTMKEAKEIKRKLESLGYSGFIVREK